MFALLLVAAFASEPETPNLDKAKGLLMEVVSLDLAEGSKRMVKASRLLLKAEQRGEPGAEEAIEAMEIALVVVGVLDLMDEEPESVGTASNLADAYLVLNPEDPTAWQTKAWLVDLEAGGKKARKAYQTAVHWIEADGVDPDAGYADAYLRLAELSPPAQREAILRAGMNTVGRDRARDPDQASYVKAGLALQQQLQAL